MSTDSSQLEVLQDDAKRILPVYIAVDHSWSMDKSENDAIDAANSLIDTIMDACAKDPIADERARFCIIGFNDHAEVVSPLQRGTNLSPHTFVAEKGTSYSEPFKLLKTLIVSDHEHLRADGFKSYRPAVFFITDGEPLDDPSDAFAALTDPNFELAPNISVFGVGHNVPESVVKQYTIRKGKPFITKNDVSASEALGGFIGLLMKSVIKSTLALGTTTTAPENDDMEILWDDQDDEDEKFFFEIES